MWDSLGAVALGVVIGAVEMRADLPVFRAFLNLNWLHLFLNVLMLVAAFGLWLMLPAKIGGSGLELSKFIVLPAVIVATVVALKLIPGDIQKSLNRQFKIFGDKHTWAMTLIYTMTFGSFIGFSAALALAIKVVFGYQHMQNLVTAMRLSEEYCTVLIALKSAMGNSTPIVPPSAFARSLANTVTGGRRPQ